MLHYTRLQKIELGDALPTLYKKPKMDTQSDYILPTITLDDGVATVVVPHRRYTFLLNDLIRDRNSRGRHNYYAHHESTMYDVAIARQRALIDSLKAEVAAGEKLIEKFSKEIENSRLEPTEKDYKKLSKVEVTTRQSAIAAALDDTYANTNTIEALQKGLDTNIWDQYVERTYNRLMRAIRNRFYIKGDTDWAHRAITWANIYAAKLRGETPLPDLPEDYQDMTGW
jgi:hypothetical protein